MISIAVGPTPTMQTQRHASEGQLWERRSAVPGRERAMKFRPVFIMGCPRSGTTLLASMLANSAKSFALPELQFIPEILKQSVVFGNDSERVSQILASSPYFLELKLCRSRAELAAIVGHGDPINAIENILSRYLVAYTQKEPYLWIEHTPQNFENVHVLRHYFPDAKFVHIVRDGRAVYASVKPIIWGPVDVVNGAEWWSRNVTQCLTLQHLLPSITITVKYEDLVSQPKDTLEKICSFLDFPYSDDMLMGRGLLKPSYSKSHELIGRAPDRQAVDRWKLKLSATEIKYFNYRNRQLLEELGYEVETNVTNPWNRFVESFIRHWGRIVRNHNSKKFRREFVKSYESERAMLMR